MKKRKSTTRTTTDILHRMNVHATLTGYIVAVPCSIRESGVVACDACDSIDCIHVSAVLFRRGRDEVKGLTKVIR